MLIIKTRCIETDKTLWTLLSNSLISVFASLEFGQNKNADKQMYILTSVADPDSFEVNLDPVVAYKRSTVQCHGSIQSRRYYWTILARSVTLLNPP